jgi:hypothetical protein
MDPTCHRCGTVVSKEITFCPTCGAPQLRFEPNEDTANYAAGLRQGYGVQNANSIRWKQAIRAAITAAIPMGVMSSSLLPLASLGCCLWIVGGAVIAVWLYRRRAAVSVLEARTGARIGLVAGILAALTTAIFSSISLVIERFVLHHGDAIDSTFQTQLEQLVRMAQSNPDPQGQMHAFLRFLATPDGKAAWILTGTATLSAGIVLFSTLGGALGARLFTRRSI